MIKLGTYSISAIVIIAFGLAGIVLASSESNSSLSVSVSGWDNLKIGMTKKEVLAVVGRPLGAMTISNIKGIPKASLTSKVRNSLQYSLWSYDRTAEPIQAVTGNLQGKTLQFNAHGILIQIGK